MSQTNGVYTYRICGTVHHKIGDLLPRNNHKPAFSQIYIFDAKEQFEIRKSLSNEIDSGILNLLQDMLHEVNPYLHIYQQAGLILREKPSLQINIVLKSNYDIDKRFNLPTSDEIAVLMIENETNNKINHRDIVISRKSLTPEQENDPNFNKLMFINENISHYDPLHYVTMFPHGDAGWQNGTIPKKNKSYEEFDENDPDSNKFVTANEFYAYMLNNRPSKIIMYIFDKYFIYYFSLFKDSHIHLFGRLFHQYIVDNYAKIEMGRLNFIKFSQSKLRADKYSNVCRVTNINKNDGLTVTDIGKPYILPSSFTGSPRHMMRLYHDAISVIQAHGRPDLFLTMTWYKL